MTLDPPSEAILLKAARRIPDADRESFFVKVANQLRHLRFVSAADVRDACHSAMEQLER